MRTILLASLTVTHQQTVQQVSDEYRIIVKLDEMLYVLIKELTSPSCGGDGTHLTTGLVLLDTAV